MTRITFTIRFFGGKGGFYLFGENIPSGMHITSDNGAIQQLDINQTSGFKVITMTGSAPHGGNIDVQVTDDAGNVLSPFEKNSYSQGPFMAAVFYKIS